jgi:L-fuconolactonase
MPGEFPIIDTHQHLWDLTRFRLPWVKGSLALDRSFLPGDYRREAEGLNIVQAVYMEVDVAPEQRVAEAEWVIDLCRRGEGPTVAAVISGDPDSPGFEPYIRRFAAESEIKGVRRVLHGGSTPPGHCLRPEFIWGIRLLGELGLSFDLCVRAAELPDAAKLVDQCPQTRFILDHCGNPNVQDPDRSAWERDLADLARRPNVIAKVSGIVAGARQDWTPADLAPFVNHVLTCFGPERVIFASDWPVCTLRATLHQWVLALKEIVADWPVAEQRALFHDNAARFYSLL